MDVLLSPCATCGRHVRSSEPACPFCGAHVDPAPPRPLPPPGLSRAGQLAWMVLLGATPAACAPARTTSPPDVAAPAAAASGSTSVGGAPAADAAPASPDAGSTATPRSEPERRQRPRPIYGAPDPEVRFAPVPFESGSTALSAKTVELLDHMARELTAHPEFRVAISGHADPGEGDRALPLSSHRAEAVRDRLVALGVPADRLLVFAFADRRNHGDPTTPEGRTRNRRVDVTMTPPPPPPPPGARMVVPIYGETGFAPTAVAFKPGSAVITPELRIALNGVAEVLLAQPWLEIEVVGKADPSEPRPEALSEKRAVAARALLVERGVPTGRVTAKGRGAKDALVRNGSTATPENRAVDFVITRGELHHQ